MYLLHAWRFGWRTPVCTAASAWLHSAERGAQSQSLYCPQPNYAGLHVTTLMSTICLVSSSGAQPFGFSLVRRTCRFFHSNRSSAEGVQVTHAAMQHSETSWKRQRQGTRPGSRAACGRSCCS